MLTANQTLVESSGHYTLTAGILIKARYDENGGIICVNFWLPGETFYVPADYDEYEFVSLTSVDYIGADYSERALHVELERAERMVTWRHYRLSGGLTKALDYLAPRCGELNGDIYRLKITQSALATLLGHDRVVVAKALGEVRRAWNIEGRHYRFITWRVQR